MAAMQRRRRRRMMRKNLITKRLVDRENPLEYMTSEELFLRFRFRADTILFIVSLVFDKLHRNCRRSNPLPPLTQVLVTLRFVATGSFYSLIADSYNGISTTSVFRSVQAVCSCLTDYFHHYVRMPTDSDRTKKQFFSIAGA